MALQNNLGKYAKKYAAETKNIEEEMVSLDQESWFAERSWWSKRASFYEGPLSRGIELWRSHPSWYMHPILRQDCAERGGCCGRACNCCFRRQGLLPHRKFEGGGHCTVYCDCCEKARGFKFTSDDIADIESLFDLSRSGYFIRICLALLGLIQDNLDDNPFDLIENMSPQYTPITTSNNVSKTDSQGLNSPEIDLLN